MFAAVLLTLAAPPAEWPQFLGPTRDSVTTETVAVWKDAPAVAWRQPIGDSHSSPVIAGGVLYAFFQPPKKDEDALAAFDAATGTKKWEKSYPRAKFTPLFGNGPRGTPTVAGGRVFTVGGTGIIAAWDAATGDVIWKVDALAEFDAPNLFFGISTSPLVEGDTVIVMVGGKKGGIVGFETATGKTKWTATTDPASYSSPTAFGSGDARQLVFLTGANLVSLSPAGKVFWTFPFKDRLNESSTTPVKAGEFLLGSSVTAGSVGLKLGTKDGVPTATKEWAEKKLNCYFSTPVVVGDHTYMVNGGGSFQNPTVALRCIVTATGKVTWEKPNVGRYHAALVRTGDGKLFMLDDNGHLKLLEADPAKYVELATAKVCGQTWAHPAIVGGTVYLRDEKEMIALTVK